MSTSSPGWPGGGVLLSAFTRIRILCWSIKKVLDYLFIFTPTIRLEECCESSDPDQIDRNLSNREPTSVNRRSPLTSSNRGRTCSVVIPEGPPAAPRREVRKFRAKKRTAAVDLLAKVICEGCLVVRSGHGPQAEVAQGVGPGPFVEL